MLFMYNRGEIYKNSALVREMLETPELIKNFKTSNLKIPITDLKKTKKLFLCGEGSSKIFPAKNIIYSNNKVGRSLVIGTEGCRQAAEYNLSKFVLFGASNSGKTKEVIELFKKKKAFSQFSLSSNENSPLKKLSKETFILNCGKENATSATKSVVEQALFYQMLVRKFNGKSISKEELKKLSNNAKKVLEMKIPKNIISKVSSARTIYFSGRNNGVAEEAVLKTNEIIGKKSRYLEGTYVVHGVEESMDRNEVVILIDPPKEEEKKFKEVLVKGVGMSVIAIGSRNTIFPTIKIPLMEGFNGYLELFMCWNLLVEVGIMKKVNLDKPKRARKIGNEFK